MGLFNRKLSYTEKKGFGTDFSYLGISFFGSCLTLVCLFYYLYAPAAEYFENDNLTFFFFSLAFCLMAMHHFIAPLLSAYEFVTQKSHKKKLLKINSEGICIKEPTRWLNFSWKELERVEIHKSKGKKTFLITRRFVNEEFLIDITGFKFDEPQLKKLLAEYTTMENLRRGACEPPKDTVYKETGHGIYRFSPLPYKKKTLCLFVIVVSFCLLVSSLTTFDGVTAICSIITLGIATVVYMLGDKQKASRTHLSLSDKGIYFYDAEKSSAFYADWHKIESMEFSPRPDFKFFSALVPFLSVYSSVSVGGLVLNKLEFIDISFETGSFLIFLIYSFIFAIKTHIKGDVPPINLIIYQKNAGAKLIDLRKFDDFNFFSFAKEINRRSRREVFSTSLSLCKRWTSMRCLHVVIMMVPPVIFCILMFMADSMIQNFANWIID